MARPPSGLVAMAVFRLWIEAPKYSILRRNAASISSDGKDGLKRTLVGGGHV